MSDVHLPTAHYRFYEMLDEEHEPVIYNVCEHNGHLCCPNLNAQGHLTCPIGAGSPREDDLRRAQDSFEIPTRGRRRPRENDENEDERPNKKQCVTVTAIHQEVLRIINSLSEVANEEEERNEDDGAGETDGAEDERESENRNND